ncbi:MAG TPA: Rieske (2Fe-2S) protein [Pseudonocardia sp.]|nr:Rieske (2Fe-2S) protein [Pseudonocardia sp.]
MSEPPRTAHGLSRRTVVIGGCGLAGGALLPGCASYGPTGPAAPAAPAAPAPAGTSLAAVADVPVGGGLVLAAQGIVLTQPAAGTIKGFSATCTHKGCTVAEVTGGTINCPCHGSKFAVADGSVTAGPAPSPLPEKAVTVQGGSVVLG